MAARAACKEKARKQRRRITNSVAWKQVIKVALVHVRKQQNVDGERVALVGMSLGGFLATTVASEPEQRVAAVVTMFGGIPPETAKTLRQFPPALILTGDKDDVVPYRQSLVLGDLLRAKNALRVVPHVYPGVGHCFKDGWGAAVDAQKGVAAFLQDTIGPNSKASAP